MAKKEEKVKAKAAPQPKAEDVNLGINKLVRYQVEREDWMENFRNKWDYSNQQRADQNWQGMNAGLSYTVNNASPSVTYTASSLGSQVKM